MIECQWVKIPKSTFLEGEGERCGRYTQSTHQIKGFGVSKWVVAGYLEVDYQKYIDEGMTLDEVAKGCAEYLSVPPPRKKYQKKPSRPLYGSLTALPAPWLGKERVSVKAYKDNQLIVEFVTDERKNKNFWYEGMSALDTSNVKKPGRPKKNKD